jgi:hypothetical protein
MEDEDTRLNIKFGYLKANLDGTYSLTTIGKWAWFKNKEKLNEKN